MVSISLDQDRYGSLPKADKSVPEVEIRKNGMTMEEFCYINADNYMLISLYEILEGLL